VLGDEVSADTLFRRALAVARKCDEKTAQASAISRLGERARTHGDLENAATLHHDAVRRFHAVGARPGTAESLDALAGIAVDRSDFARAARLFGAAAGLRDEGGWARRSRPHDRYDTDLARLREHLGDDQLLTAWTAGAALGADEAVAYACRGRGRRARAVDGPGSLTPAERQVTALAVQGLTSEEIAGRLFVSPRTVHSHLRRIYGKLGVTSRRELRQVAGKGGAP
jgi:DNA-binding CsgD family transcriptional regulator